MLVFMAEAQIEVFINRCKFNLIWFELKLFLIDVIFNDVIFNDVIFNDVIRKLESTFVQNDVVLNCT